MQIKLTQNCVTHICVMCNALKNSRKEHMKGNLLCQNVKAKLKRTRFNKYEQK